MKSELALSSPRSLTVPAYQDDISRLVFDMLSLILTLLGRLGDLPDAMGRPVTMLVVVLDTDCREDYIPQAGRKTFYLLEAC